MKTTLKTTSIQSLADMLTPVSAYSKLRDHYSNTLLLESADFHSIQDSKSFICLEPISGFEAKGLQYNIESIDGTITYNTANISADVFKAFTEFTQQFEVNNEPHSSSVCGLFGYSSFEAVQYMEDILLDNPTQPTKDNPDLKYQLFRYVLEFDHFKDVLTLTENHVKENTNSNKGLKRIMELLKGNHSSSFPFSINGEEESSITDDTYKGFIEKGVAHCQRGDVFQVVLSREFKQAFKGDEFNVYRSLRSINPSPYLFYFDYGSFKIMGASPESQLKIEDGVAHINPIAGTALRGGNVEEDALKAKELLNNPKEKAEHVMLVDLARNDMSKYADEVSVSAYAEIQYFSHVIHMVSKVSGLLSSKNDQLNVYASTFPAGTLSGAPKYRALQIINECEPHQRNFYGGSIGFIGFDGSINKAIIIRSILSKNHTLTYQAGAGVVIDSSPEGELQEVNNKLAAIRMAIKNAEAL
ncbi:MAG: anthranilate synthase component I family protein [Flavobacteriales bacterium]|nr:anthranilate synthase component I family protein [Flavobacteriales bacterium]